MVIILVYLRSDVIGLSFGILHMSSYSFHIARLTDSLCCLEEVVHVMLISKGQNNFGFLFPPHVFNISDHLLSLRFDALVFFLFMLRSNIILPNAEGFSLFTQECLESPPHSSQTSPGAFVRCGRLSQYMLCG